MDTRELQFRQMVAEFPDSPMGHFSLGKYYLETARYLESVQSLKTAVSLDANYAAAWVALGDAHVGAQQTEEAKTAWKMAMETPHGKRDSSLQADLEERMSQLE